MKTIQADEFLKLGEQSTIMDVRSPGEYEKGHIPGAVNLSVFDNNERAIIGVLYKNQGRQDAIRKGLELIAPKMTSMVDKAMELAKNNTILVHCWRGGMRSSSVAWLLEISGLEAYVMEGGYKAYRSFIRQDLLVNRQVVVLGGLTGSGKTKLIQALAQADEPVIDLEGLANHRGSVFGAAGLSDQPSTEHFENLLYAEMQKMPAGSAVWLEDESKRIGSVFLPDDFYKQLRITHLAFVQVSDKERTDILVEEYGAQPADELAEAIKRLKQRLGGLITQKALGSLAEKKYGDVVSLLLPYYDKLYKEGLSKRDQEKVHMIDLSHTSDNERINLLRKFRLSVET